MIFVNISILPWMRITTFQSIIQQKQQTELYISDDVILYDFILQRNHCSNFFYIYFIYLKKTSLDYDQTKSKCM